MTKLGLLATLRRRIGVSALFCVSSLSFSISSATAQAPVAFFTHKAPAATEYILQGTMPIPVGTWSGGDAAPTLAIRNADGTIAPTQMEVVTRSASGVPEVVELIAKVKRSASAQVGDPIDFAIVMSPGTTAAHSLHPRVQELIEAPGDLVMRTYDVHGNRYEADILRDWHIGNLRDLKDGRWIQQNYGHDVLLPTASANMDTALPHMMGVHTYLTTYRDAPFVSLDLIVHNAMSGIDDETPIDDLLEEIYFRRLTMDVPLGWSVLAVFDNPSESDLRLAQHGQNQEFDIITSLPQGKLQMMPRQSRFTRRYILVHTAQEGAVSQAEEMLQRGYRATLKRPRRQADLAHWTWWNPATSFYFPQKFPLPVLTDFDLNQLGDALKNKFDRVKTQIEAGTTGIYPFTNDLMGWCHPWGEPYGGSPGGDEIFFVDGIRTLSTENIEGYRLAELIAKGSMDRQPMGFYGPDGDPLMLRDLIQVTPQGEFYADIHFQLVPSGVHSFPRFDKVDKTQAEYVRELGLEPHYERDIREWRCIDIQHLIRYTRNFKILAYLGNDSLAKDELRLTSEIYRLSFHELPSNPGGYVQGSGLLSRVLITNDQPGQGIAVGRGEAWGMDTACAAFALGDDQFRARFLPWFNMFADVVELGQSDCTGNIMSFTIHNFFNGQYTVRQSFEVSMVEQALRSIGESVYKGVDRNRYFTLREVQEASTYSSMSAPFWSEEHGAPWFTVGTGQRYPVEIPDLCLQVPNDAHLPHVDFNDYWNALAYTYSNNGDIFLLRRMWSMLRGADTLLGTNQLHYQLRIEARAALIQLLETPLPQ